MTTSISDLQERSARQRADLPVMYGSIDFARRPERFTDDPAVESTIRPALAKQRGRLLANKDRVAMIEAFTMLGDTVGDAYAALMPELGFRRLVEMLDQACDHGVETVEDAPPELAAFIADMERIPDWLDMGLVEEGARLDRNKAAHLSPYVIRGAFIGTFTNTYAALPMAITGSLSNRTAAKRVKETGSFFSCSVLPGALARNGVGFKSAAKVRLMHSMVRFNILKRGKWDADVYGIPIPQVDQMPAGLIPTFMLARTVLASGRDHFSPSERAQVELARYRCFLLGLPEELLPDTPRAMVDVMATRSATLKQGYDDETCGALVRATMAAYLEPDESRRSKFRDRFERSFGQVFFVKAFIDGDNARAAEMGIELTRSDMLRAAAVGALVTTRIKVYDALLRIPATRARTDARLVKKIESQLERLGHAEFTTDASAYRPADSH